MRDVRENRVSSPGNAACGAALQAGPARRAHWLRCPSDALFAFGVSFVWLALYNFPFWRQTIDAMWRPSFASAAFLASVFVLVLWVQALLLLIMPSRFLMRLTASFLFVVAATSSYFTQTYGALMDKAMLRNAFQTDAAEVGGLIGMDLLWRTLLLGVAPAVLVWFVALPDSGWRLRLRRRLYAGAGVMLLAGGGVLGCSADYAVYLRQHKPIRFALSPVAPLVSALQLVVQEGGHRSHEAREDPGGAGVRAPGRSEKPLVVLIVVGETARAANFQLGGYPRETTPRLAAMSDVIYFSQASSCGTSTAVSVPCMFSHLPREQFAVHEAGAYTNVLDSLADAGLDVEWRDNNAGCKGVCARIRTISYAENRRPQACEHAYCYDEIVLDDLSAKLAGLQHDAVIVFHQIGSHGPAYWERYPERQERFSPACRSADLHRCTEQEVVNAYDNTIAYTDFLLARQIELLNSVAQSVDSILIYASDHGESLGERGVYLHGMPYGFAPAAQKQVPMLMWASPGYVRRAGLDLACLRARSTAPVSHDNLYHTILGAAETLDRVYDPDMDLLTACRSKPRPETLTKASRPERGAEAGISPSGL